MFRDEVDDAFDVDAPVSRNNSVRDYQYFSYTHPTPNMPSRIELRFDDTSKYFLPCEAFIEIEGQLTKSDNTAYADLATTAIGFVNNGIMGLFKSAQYIIGTTKIESIDNDVDVASTIIGLARYSDDFIKSAGHAFNDVCKRSDQSG